MSLQEVLRQEKKFLLRMEEDRRLYRYLYQLMREDKHNGSDGYLVRSLYFDTLNDTDYFEKKAGVSVRRKIRLRVYHPDSTFALLEMKQKEGIYQRKRSIRIERADAQRLVEGDYEPLLNYPDEFAKECYGFMKTRCYLPKCVVEYNRRAFAGLENNTRITFDSQIRATESNFDIFDSKLCTYPVMNIYDTILEVKFNQFMMGYVKEAVQRCSKSEVSMSKYIMARRVTFKEGLM